MQYFVAYSFKTKDGLNGMGSVEIYRHHRIVDYNDLQEITEELCNEFGFENAVILNYKRF